MEVEIFLKEMLQSFKYFLHVQSYINDTHTHRVVRLIKSGYFNVLFAPSYTACVHSISPSPEICLFLVKELWCVSAHRYSQNSLCWKPLDASVRNTEIAYIGGPSSL